MFSMTLPDFMPRDSHTLWYTSSRGPVPSTHLDPAQNPSNGQLIGDGLQDGASAHPIRRHGAAIVERSALSRLRADEALQERRRHNVGNFGATWLKPPGITKSLYQLREERREAEEHAEAVRREQLAQQLAEAEAEGEGLDGDMDVVDEAGDGADGAGDVQEPVEHDLDDEIPDADEGLSYDAATTTSEEDSDEAEDDDDDDDDEIAAQSGRPSFGAATRSPGDANVAQQRQELRAVVATEHRLLGIMSRGHATRNREDDMYPGADDDLDEEEAAEMLQEEDLIHASYDNGLGDVDDGLGMDMDGDLDDEIPEAESGGYEHTDSEASLTSSYEEDDPAQASFVQGRPSLSQQFRDVNSSAQRQRGNPRSSLDLSSVLSRDESSALGSSSPQVLRLP